MLCAAFVGREPLLAAYAHAVRRVIGFSATVTRCS
jgi:S-adenosylmethionine:tRNA-ribosyltransferase-isomerase (queuine synthetase)